MTSLSSARRPLLLAGAAALLIAFAACTSPGPVPPPPAPPGAAAVVPAPADPLASLAYDQSQQPVADLDRDIAAAGNDEARLAPIAARLLGLLRQPSTTFAARQAICQRLGELPASLVLAGDAPEFFTGLLLDAKQANLARLALQNTPGSQVDALFLGALKQARGGARLALVQSVGNRRLAAAVKPLAKLLRDSDAATATAAAVALGQIGTEASLAALAAAPDPSAPAVAEARLVAADRLGGAPAIAVYNAVFSDPHAPASARSAAFHQLLVAQRDRAAARIVDVLSRHDTLLEPVAIETVATLAAPDLVPALAGKLASFDASTQVAVIAAFGRRGDGSVSPALIAATHHADPLVRASALDALGRLPGNPAVVGVLADLIAGSEADDAKLARVALARLDGPGVAETIRSGAKAGDATRRGVFLEQLALRNSTEDLPLLFSMRADPDPAVRSEALSALGDLAPGSAQAQILDWARSASDPAEQARALRALANVSLRISDPGSRARLVTDAIEQAPAPVALRLLPVLPRIGGAASAASAARLAARDDAALAGAAVSALTRWSDTSGLDALVGVAESTADEGRRAATIDGAVRLLERNRDLPSAELTGFVSRLLPKATVGAVRVRLVRLLGRSTDDAALALAQQLKSDAALSAEANDAIVAIQAGRAGAPTARASDGWAANLVDGRVKSTWGVFANAGQWIEIDYHAPRPIHQVTLDQGNRPDDFPEHYEVYVTDDPSAPGEVRASGAGESARTVIPLPPGTRGRYLIIRNTVERHGGWWSIGEVLID